MTKHTPGPWVAREFVSGHWQVVDDDHAYPLAGVHGSNNGEANARLIAAAPELLEACNLVLLRDDVADSELGDSIRKAIAKATGE